MNRFLKMMKETFSYSRTRNNALTHDSSGFDSCIIRTALRYYPDPDLVLPGNSSGIIQTR